MAGKSATSLMKAEKEATRALDALAARRRRLPMVKFDPAKYEFASSDGPVTLIDLFDGRRQLVVYQFMDVGPDDFCPGCTNFTNNIVNLPSLTEYDASWANVSNMPLAQIEGYKARMGWTLQFVSSHGTNFSADCGCSESAASCSACSCATATTCTGPGTRRPGASTGSCS